MGHICVKSRAVSVFVLNRPFEVEFLVLLFINCNTMSGISCWCYYLQEVSINK